MEPATILESLKKGDIKVLARTISLVENEAEGYYTILESLLIADIPVIGITGPPGAGKSTLTDSLIAHIVGLQKKVAVLCVDPSSPFHLGALLGDRIRMSQWYNNENVFIRSLASRGALGGLSAKIIEITDVLKAGDFDVVLVETVGIGQSEIEIAGLADVTLVVLVPEAGDEVQAMKAGMMEIADIFAVNKADRPGADIFINNLRAMTMPTNAHNTPTPIIKTIATTGEGIADVYAAIQNLLTSPKARLRKNALLTDKAWQLLQQKRMRGIDKISFTSFLQVASKFKDFNLWKWVEENY